VDKVTGQGQRSNECIFDEKKLRKCSFSAILSNRCEIQKSCQRFLLNDPWLLFQYWRFLLTLSSQFSAESNWTFSAKTATKSPPETNHSLGSRHCRQHCNAADRVSTEETNTGHFSGIYIRNLKAQHNTKGLHWSWSTTVIFGWFLL